MNDPIVHIVGQDEGNKTVITAVEILACSAKCLNNRPGQHTLAHPHQQTLLAYQP
jgi:hypothetical protein